MSSDFIGDFIDKMVDKFKDKFEGGKKYKEELEALQSKVDSMGYTEVWEVEQLHKDLEAKYKRLNSEFVNKKQDLDDITGRLGEYETLESLRSDIVTETSELESIQRQLYQTNEVLNLRDEQTRLTHKVEELQKQTLYWEGIVEEESNGVFIRADELHPSEYYKEEIKANKKRQSQLKKEKGATNAKEWTVEGSKTEGKKMTNSNIKQILRAFDHEVDVIIKTLTFNNFQSKRKAIDKSYEQLNKMNVSAGVELTPTYLRLKQELLDLVYKEYVKKEEEKEVLREQREREREEKKALAEINKQKKKADKDIKHFSNIERELRLKLEALEDENKRLELEKELADLEAKKQEKVAEKESLDFRVANTKAGYVYIISNIGSFGEDIVKIGVTRRLEPYERVKELSSASVPFKYDVHAMVFSEDAFRLESELHNKLTNKRVNLVNNRKEFFNVNIEEVKELLADYQNLTINFEEEPEALEYKETLKLRQ